MEVPEFKDFAKEMVDYIGNYLENIRERLVTYEYNRIMKPSSIMCCKFKSKSGFMQNAIVFLNRKFFFMSHSVWA